MRLLLFAICLMAITGNLHAQDSLKQGLHFINLKGNFGKLSGGSFSVAIIPGGGHHEFSLGMEYYSEPSRNTPADFECWSCKHGLDKDYIAGGRLSYGYIVYPGFMKGYSRIVLRTGVLVGQQSIPGSFVKVQPPTPFDNNYSYSYDRKLAVAWLANPSLDLALGPYIGVGIGPYALVSRDFWVRASASALWWAK